MKTIRLNSPGKNVLFIVLATIVAFSMGACARKVTFLTSPVVPAARGWVKIKKDNNNNYNIKINLSDLAESKRLQPSKETYVVWMVTNEQSIKNIGQINSSTSLFSKKLKASFETVSAFKPTKIFITAENDASIQYPGTQVVLSTDRF